MELLAAEVDAPVAVEGVVPQTMVGEQDEEAHWRMQGDVHLASRNEELILKCSTYVICGDGVTLAVADENTECCAPGEPLLRGRHSGGEGSASQDTVRPPGMVAGRKDATRRHGGERREVGGGGRLRWW